MAGSRRSRWMSRSGPRARVLGSGVQAPGWPAGRAAGESPALAAGPAADSPTGGSHQRGEEAWQLWTLPRQHQQGGLFLKTQVLRHAAPQLPEGSLRLLSGDAPCEAPAAPPSPHTWRLTAADVRSRWVKPRCGLVQPLGLQALLDVWLRLPVCAPVLPRPRAMRTRPRDDTIPPRLFPNQR